MNATRTYQNRRLKNACEKIIENLDGLYCSGCSSGIFGVEGCSG